MQAVKSRRDGNDTACHRLNNGIYPKTLDDTIVYFLQATLSKSILDYFEIYYKIHLSWTDIF